MHAGLLRACCLLASLRPGARADTLWLPTYLADHMVMPREPFRARLWGRGTVGADVSVSLHGQGATEAYAVTVGQDGKWLLELDPHPAGVGYRLDIACGAESAAIEDVAFGDLWMCAGQSNMNIGAYYDFAWGDWLTNHAQYAEGVRIGRVAEAFQSVVAEDVPSASSQPNAWDRVTIWSMDFFSAVCYGFATRLYDQLGRNVPLGLIQIAWSGASISEFMHADALADTTCGGTQSHADIPALASFPRASVVWNGMVNPFLNFRWSGVVWYQGESAVWSPDEYACHQPAMFADWRVRFGLPDATFVFVEMHAFEPPPDFEGLRHAQRAALGLDNVGMATAIDLGDPQAPQGKEHPRRKSEIARRLVLETLRLHYGRSERGLGPEVAAVDRVGADTFRIRYTPESSAGLHSHGAADCHLVGSGPCCAESPFEAEVDGEWTRVASWAIYGDSVELSGVPAGATALRYAWEGYPQCIIYNGEGGPDDHLGIAGSPFTLEIATTTGTITGTTSTTTRTTFTTTGTTRTTGTTTGTTETETATTTATDSSTTRTTETATTTATATSTTRTTETATTTATATSTTATATSTTRRTSGPPASAGTYKNGPSVSNHIHDQCSGWYWYLEDAQAACDAIAGCISLHDYACDGKGWRTCTSTIHELQSAGGDSNACSQINTARSRFPEEFFDGPRVSDHASSLCSSWYGTLGEALSRCRADSTCFTLHDYACDEYSWRHCSQRIQDLQVVGGHPRACTKVLLAHEGIPIMRQYLVGPHVSDSGIAPICSSWSGTLEAAEDKCNHDVFCSILHDAGCDGQDWRYCTGTVQTFLDLGPDTASCTRVDSSVAAVGAYVPGPRVSNSAQFMCGDWYGDLWEARARCSADPDCKALHDWKCDTYNWRLCTTSVASMISAHGNGGDSCTEVHEVL